MVEVGMEEAIFPRLCCLACGFSPYHYTIGRKAVNTCKMTGRVQRNDLQIIRVYERYNFKSSILQISVTEM